MDLNTDMECRTREMMMKLTQTWSKSRFPYTCSRIGSRCQPSWDTDWRNHIDHQHSMVGLDMTNNVRRWGSHFKGNIINPVDGSWPHFLDVPDLQATSTSRKASALRHVAQMARLNIGRYLSKDTGNLILAHGFPLQILTGRWLSAARFYGRRCLRMK